MKEKIFIGEGGEELILDEYKIVKKAFSKLGYSAGDIFKQKEQERQAGQPQPQAPQAGMAGQGSPVGNGVGVPTAGANLGSAVRV